MSTNMAFLDPLYAYPGPYASVVLETGRAPEDAAEAIALRWRGLRDELAGNGTDEDTLAALDEVVGTPSGIGGEQGQLAVASAGTVVLDERLRAHPGPGVARWERLPYVTPLLRELTDQVPCLLVQVDSEGADLEVRGPSVTDTAKEVTGSDHPLHKVRKGGHSHRRLQQRVEDTVRDNARFVAGRVDDLVRRTGVDLVVLAGDPGARSSVTAELAPDTRNLVADLDSGSRHADGQDVDALVADVVRQHARSAAASLVATFRAELGQHRHGVAGLDATVEALRRAQADTVLVEDGDDSDVLWVGDDPLALARQPEVLETLGVEVKYRVPATSALARAATRSGAGVRLVEAGATGHRDGVGAVLRYVPEPAGSVHA